MTKISVILTSNNNLNKNNLDKTLSSIKNQTLQDLEIIVSENIIQEYPDIFNTYFSEDKKIISTQKDNTTNKLLLLNESKAEYVYFMNIGEQFTSNNTLENIIKQIDNQNIQLIQYNSHNDETIDFYSKKSIYNTIFQREYLKQITNHIGNNTISDIVLLTHILIKYEKVLFVNERLTKKSNPEKIDNLDELEKYLESLLQTINILIQNKKTEHILELSKNLQKIQYENIQISKKSQLESINNQINNIKTKITENNNKLAYYYFNKYFRTLKDILYNTFIEHDILISVIIPTYNVEKYIDDCLNSLINQSLKNIEIICVDDLSTDTTPEILEYYEQKYENIHCYYMKEKKGSGGCRNYALKHAKGKYIQYCDSDDWLDINALKDLYEIAEKNKTQILIYKSTNYVHNEVKFYKKEYFVMKQLNPYLNKMFSIDELKKEDVFKISVVPWNKLYLRTFLEDVDAKFPENIIHQDNPYYYETILQADRIYIIDEYFYNYREREKSITSLKDETEVEVIKIIENILIIFRNNSLYNLYKKELVNHLYSKFNYRYWYVNVDQRTNFYNKAKKMTKKFIEVYNMREDLDKYLLGSQKNFYKGILATKSNTEFINWLSKHK